MFDNIDEIDIISLKVIEKNDFLKAARQAKERKEELSRVLNRVDNICDEFEKPLILNSEFSSLNSLIFGEKSIDNSESTNVEIVKDVPALEQLLVSYKSRQKYLQQVTVFIVGYAKVASDRLRLMQEVNQFFINSEDMFDSFIEREEKIFKDPTEPEVSQIDTEIKTFAKHPDEEEYSASQLEDSVQKAIDSCKGLTNRLSELNNDMIECFVKYAQNKAGNKGRKKLEKALENAANESSKLGEKLAESMKAISEKDLRIENLVKQCESKSKEVQKFKAAAESIKKAALESDKLREQVQAKDSQILNLQSELAQSQLKIEQTKTLDAAERANAEEMAREYQEKCKNLAKLLENQKIEFEETKRNMKRQHAAELKQKQADNELRLQQMEVEHNEEVEQLKSSEFDENAIALQWSEPEDEELNRGRRSSGAPSKNDKGSPLESQKSVHDSSLQSRSGSAKLESRQRTILGSDRSSGKDIMSFNDAPDLDNEEFWSTVPRNHLVGRFSQYRQLTMASMSNLMDDMETLQTSNSRQIHSLKAQHQLHSKRWDREREMLIEAVRKTEDEKKEAQDYTNLTMTEMEDFVSLMKLDEKDNDQSNFENILNTKDLELIEKVDQIKNYLKDHDLLTDPANKMIEDLMDKCRLIQERTRISVPKFVTMLDLHRNNQQQKSPIINATHADDERPMPIDTVHESVLDEDKDIPFPEEYEETAGKKSVAISASPTLVRTGLSIIHHPVVTDYLHTYDQILTFKENLLSVLENLDKSEVSEILNLKNLIPVSIRSQNKIIPQIEEIGKSIGKILQESSKIIERLLLPKKKNIPKLNKDAKSKMLSPTKGKQLLAPGKTGSSIQIGILLEECKEMKYFVKLFQQSYQSKFSFINNTMSKLKQMFAILNKQYTDKLSAKEFDSTKSLKMSATTDVPEPHMIETLQHQPTSPYDSVSIYFNHRHTDRNIRTMQQAICNNDFPQLLYEEAIEKMANYVEIPAKQLYILVKKYLHKYAMDQIARAVKDNPHFTADTFKILNQMESNIEKKQRRYKEIQDYLRNERIIRAKELLDTFERIENGSSIFMIKPTISVKSKNAIKQFIVERNLIKETDLLKQNIFETLQMKNKVHQNNTLNRVVIHSKFRADWRPDDSIEKNEGGQNTIFESKLLEIDTNRMLLPVNSVCVPYNGFSLQGNGSTLPPQLAVRSYVAVAHPTVVDIENSENSHTPGITGTTVDMCTRSRMSKDLSKHIPLPPITSLEIN